MMKTRFLSMVEIGGRICERFPLIVSDNGEAVIDVMRYMLCLFNEGNSYRSLETYSGHLRDFFAQLAVDGLTPSLMTVDYLNGYKEAIGKRASTQYAAQVLRTVLSFLLWMEEQKLFRGIIGEDCRCAITIKRAPGGAIQHALTKGSASPKSNHFPSDKAISVVKARGPRDCDLADRYKLMVDWCQVKGLRAKEVCGLLLTEVPDLVTIERAISDGRALEITLTVTKGSKPRIIEVHPLLLARTRTWISTARRLIVRRAGERARVAGWVYREPSQVFLSHTGAAALSPRAFSNSVRAAFLSAVADGELSLADRTWAHGLRKAMINREVRARGQKGANQREHALRHETGHGSLASLGRYVVTEQWPDDE
ncbi:phage integrase family protein [Dyella solisilvae]|nr:phage integrase family protein [Dyella solisilvae]